MDAKLRKNEKRAFRQGVPDDMFKTDRGGIHQAVIFFLLFWLGD